MHSVRNETASLLQTVYLAEIGIQSLQDCLKGPPGGVGNGTPHLPPLPPLLAGGNAETDADAIEVDGGVAGGGASGLNDYTGFEESPPTKKR